MKLHHKRRQPVHQVQLFQKWGGGGNANWIVFASTMAKLDLLLGVCLLLETFYGYSKLTCWIDRAKFGPVGKVFILGVSDQQCLHETLLCLFLLSVLSSSYYKLSMHNDVAQHQGRPRTSGESKVAIPMVSIRCRNNPSHEVEEPRDALCFSRKKLHPWACFNYKQENLRAILYHMMPMWIRD